MDATTSPSDRVDLVIGGMTCASCAARIEKRLNKIEGVTATVNFATEQAKVALPTGVSADDLIAQVEAAGYSARLPEPSSSTSAGAGGPGLEGGPDETAALRTRLLLSLIHI